MDFRDSSVLQEESQEAVEMGFTGKQLIHPLQIDLVNEEFAPKPNVVERAVDIVKGYREHYQLGKGAFDLHGKAIDMPVVKYSTECISTFANQGKLPRLPVPTLEATAARYLKSLQPLLSNKEFEQAEKAVSQFIGPDGLGPILQQRLLQADKEAPSNWLEDIWLNKAYLEYRESNFINSNWAAIIGSFAESASEPLSEQATPVQVEKAARMITHLLEANEAINNQQMPADLQRGDPLCMNQFKWQFGTTRIPKIQRDEIRGQWPCSAKHIVILYRGQTVSVPVYNGKGQRASLVQITAQLNQAARSIDTLLQKQQKPSIGLLTAGNRDNWARARQLLEPDNGQALEQVESALFAVCLDTGARGIATTGDGIDHMLRAYENRWFDKAIQLVVLGSGRMGVNCEHAPVDALTTGRLLMEALNKESTIYKDISPCADLPPAEPIAWNVDAQVQRLIETAQEQAQALAADLKVLLGDTKQYGAQWIKKLGVSPDAFFQIALQATYFQMHGQAPATYETASLRRFLHGRTETIRSCSQDSLQFSRAFGDNDVPLSRQLRLFQQAVAAHVEYSRAAASGQGVDRHLLGLFAQIRSPEEAQRASLFQDPSYARSTSFRLSTSNVTPGDIFRGSFAPVVRDGYGVNYALDKNDLKFTVSEWISASGTSAAEFRECLLSTLTKLHDAGQYAMTHQLLAQND
ncbi:hypothetical protein IWW36_004724 [Coemansia brasiliensis]|uniref:Choline/carnitine acyltransferase domain-containing protein n=1 Tax=Coemansia brasiliensis TaxID=2650707 RepID=A0A9W8LXB7_9FUNG|nr:hypothetical protein IWW36_004724 [Coemansia brasiliensis]